jgi:hypothetical protein
LKEKEAKRTFEPLRKRVQTVKHPLDNEYQIKSRKIYIFHILRAGGNKSVSARPQRVDIGYG